MTPDTTGWIAIAAAVTGVAAVRLLERRNRIRTQVQAVRHRLTQSPTYRTVVQLNSDGSLAAFTCRVPLSVGTHVSVDIRGELAPMGPHSLVLGVVVSQEIEL